MEPLYGGYTYPWSYRSPIIFLDRVALDFDRPFEEVTGPSRIRSTFFIYCFTLRSAKSRPYLASSGRCQHEILTFRAAEFRVKNGEPN